MGWKVSKMMAKYHEMGCVMEGSNGGGKVGVIAEHQRTPYDSRSIN